MALPHVLPVAAVVLFGALFGGGGTAPRGPEAQVAHERALEGVSSDFETRGKTEVWAVRTWPVHVRNPNTNATCDVRLYTDEGTVDEDAMKTLVGIVNPGGEPEDPRVLLLAMRAAYFFGATSMEALSGHRKDPRETSKHHSGEALDFKLDRVESGALAAHLRGYGHVGVGIYTHPRTRYVHLDTREVSFHWIDSSPPGKTWREANITDRKVTERDFLWTANDEKPLFLAVSVPKRL